MALNDFIRSDAFKENVGVPNAIKASSARKNIFGVSKKANVLADVKNIFHSKQKDQAEFSNKKQQSVSNQVVKSEISEKISSVIKGDLNEIEDLGISSLVLTDDEDYDYEDCPHCLNDDEDLLDTFEWPKELRLTDDAIRKFCLDPNPKSRDVPTPEFDIHEWYKNEFIPPMSPPSFDVALSPLKLPQEFYEHDILPVFCSP